MPPSRPRHARSTSAAPTRVPGGTDEMDALESWDATPESASASPLLALIDAAAEAGIVDPRTLADTLGLSPAELGEALDDPERLSRAHRDALARALGVERHVLRAACDAALRARAPSRAEPRTTDERPEPTIAPVAERDDSDGAKRAAAPVSPVESPVRDATVDVAAGEPGAADLPEATPGSLAELLERVIAAVADDAVGRRIRLSLLTTVQTAAAEVGRPVPPEVHALRARVLNGMPPWIGEGGTFVDEPNAPADRELLDAVAGAIHAAQRQPGGGGYDDLFAPLHDDALDALLRRTTIAVRQAALGTTSACIVTPPVFGRHLVLCSADAPADLRRVALRRALAHVLCGHVGESTPLPHPAPAAAARAADVFALADLVPFWQLDDWRRSARLGWRAIMAETARLAATLASDWDATRAADAARLRVLLYREWKL